MINLYVYDQSKLDDTDYLSTDVIVIVSGNTERDCIEWTRKNGYINYRYYGATFDREPIIHHITNMTKHVIA